jgi:phosphate/sulfate permease
MEGEMNPHHDSDIDPAPDISADLDVLLAYARGVNNEALGIEAVAYAIVTVIKAERRFARVSYALLVMSSMAISSICAFMAAWSLHAPLPGAVIVGLSAGTGAASAGVTLIPWDTLSRQLRDLPRRWRSR